MSLLEEFNNSFNQDYTTVTVFDRCIEQSKIFNLPTEELESLKYKYKTIGQIEYLIKQGQKENTSHHIEEWLSMLQTVRANSLHYGPVYAEEVSPEMDQIQFEANLHNWLREARKEIDALLIAGSKISPSLVFQQIFQQENFDVQMGLVIDRVNILEQKNKAISDFSGYFAEESEKHSKTSDRWLYFAGVILIVIFIVLLVVVHEDTFKFNGTNTLTYLSLTFPRVVLLGLCLSFLFWSAKMYKNNKHMAATYKFKALSLNTFEKFVENTTNEEVKNQVLLEATRSIFSQPQTDLLDKESSPNEASTIIEIVKNIKGSGKD